ncbi:MAG TPA: DciA family protein [Geminicoccaceae bacterium]|nr:DciA family protein [Geminicoccaceae bacterium]
MIARRGVRKARQTPAAVRRGGGLRRLPELLSRVLDPAARRRGLAEARILTDWPLVVGQALGTRCQPVRLSRGGDAPGGVLTVHVGSASALELQHSAPQLIERINGFFGYPAVAGLRLIQAPPARPVKPRAPARLRPLAAAEVAAVEGAVAGIADPNLRSALVTLGRTVRAQLPGQDDWRAPRR